MHYNSDLAFEKWSRFPQEYVSREKLPLPAIVVLLYVWNSSGF
jgi:hypothetical protein